MIREYRSIDKSSWPAGPWHAEPDKIHWIDAATDMDCLMHRNASGAWCGYVAVAEGHPAFERSYHDLDLDVHGGLTYADFCQETTDERKGVCHVPFAGRPHRVWWLGFDCAHAFDSMPSIASYLPKSFHHDHDVYRDRAYVEGEVRHLAKQLAAL